jgi:hypothetical protein
VYVSTYPHLCLAPRRRVRRYLCLDLNLDLNLAPYPTLNRALFRRIFQKPFRKLNPSSFRSL